VIQLRPYQADAVNAVYEHLRCRDDNPCVVIPTAGGKTPLMATICRDAVTQWDGRVLILAHVKELIEQAVDKLHAMAPDLWHQIGCYSAGLKSRDTDHAIIVAGIQSVYRKAAELDSFDLILIDEAHMLPPNGEGMYQQFLQDAKAINPNVRLIGLTATPYRMTSGTICGSDHLLNHICYEVGVRELIAQGYLCPLKTKAGRRKADTSGLHIRAGEFIAGEVEALMDDDALVHSACREIVEQTRDRNSVLIFAASVQHAQHVQRVLADMGHECGFVCGDSSSIFRDDILRRFKDGNLKYLVNVSVLTTGFDAPNIDCVALLRPTNSPGLYYQMLGRGFRLHPNKSNCLVLDFGGNILRHGPVDALQIKDKSDRKGNNEAPAKECPNCQALIHASYSICPDCSHEFPPPERDKHDGSASTAGVLSGEVTETDYDVSSVYYSIHTKRGAPPEHPKTLRVDYRCGFNEYHSEWICVAHPKGSYAWQKAHTWWQARSNEQMPDTVEQAVELAENGALAQPLSITVRSVTGEKFDRITNYELGSIPPRIDGSDEREPVASTVSPDQPWTEWSDDEIPF
jgi:DNA repair protein RadD